ncbi:MAG TPA: GAF domain-containing protein [Polyangiaceae bacterium]|nr:GAF domain-containing protein [Polyangiaceae bacterium]
MRWLVEVASLGKAETESLYVDAESWQKALQTARGQRGESAPLSGFSIELLDDGCRAVDPMSRLRYQVRRAPDGAAAGAAAPAPSTRPSTAPPPAATAHAAHAPPAATAHAAHAAPASTATTAPSAATATAAATSAPAAATAGASAQAPRPAASSTKRPPLSAAAFSAVMGPAGSPAAAAPLTPAPPVAVPAPAPPPAAAIAHAAVAPAAPAATAPAPAAMPAPVPAAAPAASAPRADIGLNVPSQIIFKREHDATDSMPLTYREYVFLVPSGTTEEGAEALLQTQLELVLASLARVPAGKLVNLGVFDVAFQGKPPVPPLATLTWKDWRGAPVIDLPRRRGHVPRASAPPPAMAAQAPFAAPAPPPAPIAAAAVVPMMPPPAPPIAAPPIAAPISAQPILPTAAPAVLAAPPSAAPAAPAAPAPPLVAAPFAAAVAAAPLPAPPVVQAPAQPPPAPPVPAPAAEPASSAAAPVATRLAHAAHPEPAAAAAGPRARARAEDLIADLFESMHDLHFLRDAVEGGDFCLGLALDKIPSQAGMVHLYDIDRREFLVTSTRGSAAPLLLRRHPETDVMLAAAMAKRQAVVVADASRTDANALERYSATGGVQSLVIAPVMQSGRFLGAIELLNPLDGQPFTEAEGNALNYIAEQFAEFVAARGVVTDPERIGPRAG